MLVASLAAGPALAAGSADRDEAAGCSDTYHGRLQAIRAAELADLSAARDIAFEGDATLAGRLLFVPPRGPHNETEMAALREANELASRQGRAAWLSSADNRWIAERIRTDLTEYLEQPDAPYLCGGVPEYLDTLRAYLTRIGGVSEAERGDRITAQMAVAARSVEAALDAMEPAPLPRYAPHDRPMPDGIAGLRPGSGIERLEGTDPIQTRSVGKGAKGSYGPRYDPDLPPLGMAKATPLATPEQRLAALDQLVRATRLALPEAMTPLRADAASGAPEDGTVLERLAALKPLVIGAGAPIRDPLAGPRLVEAFSDVEVLDYLVRAQEQGPDPLLGAIAATIDAIENAHAASCTCRS